MTHWIDTRPTQDRSTPSAVLSLIMDPSIFRRGRSMRRGWWLAILVAGSVVACAVPEARPSFQVAANDTPEVVGARGPLSPAEARQVVEKLERESGGSD